MTFAQKRDIMKTLFKMQASPSGMAAASQAVPGEFDSRRLLQKDKRTHAVRFSFLKSKCVSTRVEGGAASENEHFACGRRKPSKMEGKTNG